MGSYDFKPGDKVQFKFNDKKRGRILSFYKRNDVPGKPTLCAFIEWDNKERYSVPVSWLKHTNA